MGLSVYVHIPYCIQRCRYCDFTTFEQSSILPPKDYVALVLKEIRQRASTFPQQTLSTLYFGGGTPSLIDPELILSIIAELANAGLKTSSSSEVTIEINPATLDAKKLDAYLSYGINRFSVGAQTFDDNLLKLCGRRHSAADTLQTLELLKSQNYSFDLLFALPSQTLEQLKRDLDLVLRFDPPHLSAYCLTVPESHPMAIGRPPEDEQISMFSLIEERLLSVNTRKYEISNFAKAGFESRHNMAYWSDLDYWGLGLSAHSYLKNLNSIYGVRFWNPKDFALYEQQVNRVETSSDPTAALPSQQKELLEAHESLTDFCHMFLRTRRGLTLGALRQKFPSHYPLILQRLESLLEQGLLEVSDGGFRLVKKGELLSNSVFLDLTFEPADLMAPLTQRAPRLQPNTLTRPV